MKKEKGFTLIELLAVIIILGVIMLIAIPSVTRYINESRKDTYIDTARQIVKGAIPLVNGGELDVYDTNTTYYIPASCIPTENSLSSPFGEFKEAYVIVGYTGEGYVYYWASVDKAHQGIEMKEYNKLTRGDVKPNMESVDTTLGIGSRTDVKILDEESCQNFKVSEGNTGSNNCNPNSFSTDSWDTIICAIRKGDTSKYNVGDTKDVNLEGFGTHTVRIANKSTPNECSSSSYSQTACGFVLEFTDIISRIKWISSYSSDGGWPSSNARTYVNSSIYNALPSNLKAGIIDTTVVSSHNSYDSSNFTSTDKLYLLAMREIYGNYIYSYDFYSNDSAYNTTRQLDYYNSRGTTEDNYGAAIKTNIDSSDTYRYWYTRTARSNSSSSVYVVLTNGYYNGTSGSYGISPAFRIG